MLKFGTSGIRGVFNEGFGLKDTYRLCYALSRTFSGSICLGYDTRRASKVLADGVLAGLSHYGISVTSFGILPTPVLAFMTRESESNAGVMLTASHNPPEYVGVKIFDKDGVEIDIDMEKRIECHLDSYRERTRPLKLGRVSFDQTSGRRYMERIITALPTSKRRLRVLVDCGNGATSKYTPRILKRLGHCVITVNNHFSSSSLGRVLEPKAGTLEETAELVKMSRVDIGIAHDGDGDRTVLIDEKGRVLSDQVLSLLALKSISNRGGTIVLSVNTASSVECLAIEMGFKVVRSRLGKTFLEMKKIGGVFATEPSKVTDSSWGVWEDGVYIAMKIIQSVSNSGRRFSDIVGSLPQSFWTQQNLPLDGVDHINLRQKIFERYRQERVEDTDGWKITFPDGSYLLLRISGTEPKIRVYVDSPDEKRAEHLLKEGIEVIEGIRKSSYN